jgi:hypothetical protein
MTFNWNVGIGDDWNTSADWNSGTVPNRPTADVEINASTVA